MSTSPKTKQLANELFEKAKSLKAGESLIITDLIVKFSTNEEKKNG